MMIYIPEDIQCSNIQYIGGQLVCVDNGLVIDEHPIIMSLEYNIEDLISNEGMIIRTIAKYINKASEILEMYRQGKTIREIMEKTGIRSVSAIYNIIHANTSTRVKHRPHRKVTRDEIETICREYKNGASIYRIAKMLGRPFSTIKYVVDKHCR